MNIASLIDHTLVNPDATRLDVTRVCSEALELEFAAVCVNPAWVALAVERLAGSDVRVAAVVNFPFGAGKEDVKAMEARSAISDGAREIDMVINIGALKSGDLETVKGDIKAVVSVCREWHALSKVIIEAAFLTQNEKVAACTLAKEAGADYVKTSTGYGPGGATLDDVRLMRRVVGDGMGVKAAGGIRDLDTALAMLAAGASRIGTSAGVRIVRGGVL